MLENPFPIFVPQVLHTFKTIFSSFCSILLFHVTDDPKYFFTIPKNHMLHMCAQCLLTVTVNYTPVTNIC